MSRGAIRSLWLQGRKHGRETSWEATAIILERDDDDLGTVVQQRSVGSDQILNIY